MADRTETLLFLIDVQVRGAQALRQLDAELDAAARNRTARLTQLNETVGGNGPGNGGAGPGNGGGPVVVSRGDGGNGGPTVVNNPPAGSDARLVGIRGPREPGSRQNPVAFAQESAEASGLGSLGVRSGNGEEISGGSRVRPTVTPRSPVPSANDRSWVANAAQEIADKVVAPEDDRVVAAFKAASEANGRTGGGTAASAAAAANGTPGQQAMMAQLASLLSSRAEQQRTVSAAEAARRMGVSTSAARELAGQGALPGAYKQGGQWMIPEQAVMDMLASGGAGGGGGRRPPTTTGGPGDFFGGRPSGRGNNGGSRTFWTPWNGLRSEGDMGSPFTFANIFRGDRGRGGMFGLPGFGSAGSLAGLGLEHFLLTGAGLGVSAGSAVAGAGLLGAAGATQSLIGGGADALVNHQALANVKTLNTDVNNLNQAIAVYGAGSKQATVAQNQLNYAMQEAGPAAKSAMQVTQQLQTLTNDVWPKASAAAQQQSYRLFSQILHLATDYVPQVTAAAERNLTIVNNGLKPLFAWLEGPQGHGIFTTLENAFARDLPTAIHALDMGIEDFLRLMAMASQYTGGLATAVDNFLTAKNKESAAQYAAEVAKLVADLREWERLLKLIGEDAALAFHQDAGTANSIVGALTDMLQRLHDWEQSTTGQHDLHTVFAVHKDQILALLQLLTPLAKGYGQFYMDIAPPLVRALTDVAKAFTAVVDAVEKIPGGADLVGLTLVLGKLGLLAPSLRALGGALGLVAKGEEAMALGGRGGGLSGALGMLGGGKAAAAAGGAERTALTGAETAGGAAAGGLLPKLLGMLKAGGGSAVERGALGAAGVAEGAGLAGLADSIASAGAAVAPVAAALTPLLAAAGGAAGLVLLFKLFSNHGQGYGEQIAGNVARQLGISRTATDNLAPALNRAQQISNQAPGYQNPAGGRFGPATGGTFTNAQQIAKQAAAAYSKAGQEAVVAFVHAVQDAKFPSTLLLFTDMRRELDALPPQARASAARTMLTYAQTLQEQGKLPRGAVSNLIQLIEAQFPGLRSYLQREGLQTGAAFAKAMSLNEAVGNTKDAVSQLKQEFGNIFDTAKVTSRNMLSQVTDDYSKLRDNMGSLTKQGRQAASQELGQMRQTALADATAMEQNVSQKMLILRDNMGTQSSKARQQVSGDFNSLVNNITAAMRQGVLGTNAGTKLIAQALNDELKAFGAPKIPTAVLNGMSAASLTQYSNFLLNGAAGTGSGIGHRATGGWVGHPGEKGRDTVPAMLGRGEAVLNHQQQGIVNQALQRTPYGSLHGVFSATSGQRHYMSTGGYAGYSLPLPRGEMLPGSWSIDQGVDIPAPAGTPEFAIGPGTIIGEGISGFGPNAPILHITAGPLSGRNVYYGHAGPDRVRVGQHVSAGQQISEVGAGIVGISTGPHIEIGFGPPFGTGGPMAATLRALMSGAGVAGIGSAGLGGAGSGPAAPPLKEPKVQGTGTIPDIVRAVMHKETAAANAYIASHLTATATTGAGFSGSLSGPVERQVLQYFSSKGFDKVAIAGMLGNAEQESSMNPNTPGGGLWQQISNFGQGTGGSLLHQMQTMLPQILGIRGALNSAGSPAAAAALFMNSFERPAAWAANLPHRQAAAAQAFAQGYSGGHDPGKTVKAATSLSRSQQAFIAKHHGKSHHPAHKRGNGYIHGLTPAAIQVYKRLSAVLNSPGQHIGLDGPFPFSLGDILPIGDTLKEIFQLDGGQGGSLGQGGDAQKMSDLIQWYTTLWGADQPSVPGASDTFASYTSPSAFVLTTDAQGNTVNPYISPNLPRVVGQLGGPQMPNMIGMQSEWVGDLQKALGLAHGLTGNSGPIEKAIKRRTDEAAKIRKRIQANVAKIRKLQQDVKNEKARKPPYAKPKTKGQHNANAAFDRQRKARVASLSEQITALEKENNYLGGSQDSVGTGGELAQITSQLGAGGSVSAIDAAEGGSANPSGLYSLATNVGDWVKQLSSTGGDIDTQRLALTQYQEALTELTPGVNSALAQAVQSAAAAAAPASPVMTGTVAFTFQGQQALAGIPGFSLGGIVGNMAGGLPYAGSFGSGGVIPGSYGAPMLATVHGGEEFAGLGNSFSKPDPATANLTAAIDQLCDALGRHEQTLAQNTKATAANTTAISSTATGGARATYSYGESPAYSPALSSDSLVNVGVGG